MTLDKMRRAFFYNEVIPSAKSRAVIIACNPGQVHPKNVISLGAYPTAEKQSILHFANKTVSWDLGAMTRDSVLGECFLSKIVLLRMLPPCKRHATMHRESLREPLRWSRLGTDSDWFIVQYVRMKSQVLSKVRGSRRES